MKKQIIKITEKELRGIVKNILNESLSSMEFINVEGEILKETEKAYYVGIKYFTEKGSVDGKVAKMWCPKSCCVVENNAVIKIAKFIIDKWLKEFFDYLKSKSSYTPSIIFNKADKNAIEAKKQREKDEYKEVYDEVVRRLILDIQPNADFNLQEAGKFSLILGEYLKNKGISIDKCNRLIVLGNDIQKQFGTNDNDWIENYFSNNPSKEFIIDMLHQYEVPIYYGCRFENTEQYHPLKYSVNDIKDYLLRSINRNIGYDNRSDLYKHFKKYIIYYDKFLDTSFDVLLR